MHSDVWGPASVNSFDGYRFYVTFIDDFSRSTFVYLLKFKSEVFKCFQDFHNLVLNLFSSKIQTLRSDNGTEYTSKIMAQFLSEQRIMHQTSCVGTPQQNGVAERKNRDLLEKARALMIQSHMPKKFWSQGIQTAAYLINRLPSRVLNFQSPFEILKGRKLDISHLRVFGCTCFVHVQAVHRDKFDPRSVKCVFLGYSSTQKGYKCFNPVTRKIIVSRDVQFHENETFYPVTCNSRHGEWITDLFPSYSSPEHNQVVDPSIAQGDMNQEVEAEDVQAQNESEHEETDVEVPHPDVVQPQPIPAPRRNPPRDRHRPANLDDYVTYSARYPIDLGLSNVPSAHSAFVSNILTEKL